jgi:hypothetical protein
VKIFGIILTLVDKRKEDSAVKGGGAPGTPQGQRNYLKEQKA